MLNAIIYTNNPGGFYNNHLVSLVKTLASHHHRSTIWMTTSSLAANLQRQLYLAKSQEAEVRGQVAIGTPTLLPLFDVNAVSIVNPETIVSVYDVNECDSHDPKGYTVGENPRGNTAAWMFVIYPDANRHPVMLLSVAVEPYLPIIIDAKTSSVSRAKHRQPLLFAGASRSLIGGGGGEYNSDDIKRTEPLVKQAFSQWVWAHDTTVANYLRQHIILASKHDEAMRYYRMLTLPPSTSVGTYANQDIAGTPYINPTVHTSNESSRINRLWIRRMNALLVFLAISDSAVPVRSMLDSLLPEREATILAESLVIDKQQQRSAIGSVGRRTSPHPHPTLTRPSASSDVSKSAYVVITSVQYLPETPRRTLNGAPPLLQSVASIGLTQGGLIRRRPSSASKTTMPSLPPMPSLPINRLSTMASSSVYDQQNTVSSNNTNNIPASWWSRNIIPLLTRRNLIAWTAGAVSVTALFWMAQQGMLTHVGDRLMHWISPNTVPPEVVKQTADTLQEATHLGILSPLQIADARHQLENLMTPQLRHVSAETYQTARNALYMLTQQTRQDEFITAYTEAVKQGTVPVLQLTGNDARLDGWITALKSHFFADAQEAMKQTSHYGGIKSTALWNEGWQAAKDAVQAGTSPVSLVPPVALATGDDAYWSRAVDWFTNWRGSHYPLNEDAVRFGQHVAVPPVSWGAALTGAAAATGGVVAATGGFTGKKPHHLWVGTDKSK